MNMKELVVCTFAGCNQVYNDARFLPCGNRTCAAHIEAMVVISDDINTGDRKMINCHFCQKIHNFPDDGDEFPRDRIIPMLFNVKYCTEHEAAKKSFRDVSMLVEKLIKLDNEGFLIDYFEQVETDILLEKEVNTQMLAAYYQELIDEVHERKVKCLQNLKSKKKLEEESAAIRETLHEYEDELKKDSFDFTLKTLDGDEAKWKEIQSECNDLLTATKSLGEQLEDSIVGDQMVQFIVSRSKTQVDSICGHLVPGSAIDSAILCNAKTKYDLFDLCDLGGKQFKLLYRASRDGFEASSFHAKCNNQARTLTIIETNNGYIFGGYTSVAWDSSNGYKDDPRAFIFTLENVRSTPLLIPVKAGTYNSINCTATYGSTFGGGHDIHIANNSNTTTDSYSNLGHSYDFKLFANGSTEAKSFLAGSYSFQTSEIEVFQLS